MNKAHAVQRLAQSRALLREQMMPAADQRRRAARATAAAGGPRSSNPIATLWRQLRRQWRQTPLADLMLDAIQGWWSVQPWRPVAEQVGETLQSQVSPIVRRHPWAAVGVAAGVGAGLVVLRPWRWGPVRANSRFVRARLVRAGMQFAAALPLQTLLGQLATLWATPKANAATDAATDAAASAKEAQADVLQRPAPAADRAREAATAQ